MTTTSNAAASACAAARVAGASPPSRPPAAVERMSTPRVGGVELDPRAVAEQRAARALGRRVDGEHGDACARRRATRARARTSSDDLPAPGGPVTPTTCAGAARRRARRGRPRAAASATSSRPSVRGSTRFSTAGAAREVARRAGARRGRAPSAHARGARRRGARPTSSTMSRMICVEVEVLRRVDRGDAGRLAAARRRPRG